MASAIPLRAVRAVVLAGIVAVASGAAAATAISPVADLRTPPPSPHEAIPAPPRSGAFTWLPGHWRWSGIGGAEWQWERGRYVEWPANATPSAVDSVLSPPVRRVWSEGDWK